LILLAFYDSQLIDLGVNGTYSAAFGPNKDIPLECVDQQAISPTALVNVVGHHGLFDFMFERTLGMAGCVVETQFVPAEQTHLHLVRLRVALLAEVEIEIPLQVYDFVWEHSQRDGFVDLAGREHLVGLECVRGVLFPFPVDSIPQFLYFVSVFVECLQQVYLHPNDFAENGKLF